MTSFFINHYLVFVICGCQQGYQSINQHNDWQNQENQVQKNNDVRSQPIDGFHLREMGHSKYRPD